MSKLYDLINSHSQVSNPGPKCLLVLGGVICCMGAQDYTRIKDLVKPWTCFDKFHMKRPLVKDFVCHIKFLIRISDF